MATRHFATVLTKTVQTALKPVVVVPKQSVHTFIPPSYLDSQCPPLKPAVPKPVKPSYPPPPKTKKTQEEKRFARELKAWDKQMRKDDMAWKRMSRKIDWAKEREREAARKKDLQKVLTDDFGEILTRKPK